MRLTDRNRRNQRARRRVEQLIQAEVYRQLRWAWNRLLPHLRRYQRERHQRKRLSLRREQQIRKQEFAQADALWEAFKERLETRLRQKFIDGSDLLLAVEESYWEGTLDLALNPDDIVRAYEDEIGQLVTNVTDDTRLRVGNTVADWYLTEGSTLGDLITRLSPDFSEARSRLIGVNEVTALNSVVTRQVMRQADIRRWFWQTMQDEVVCVHSLEGPDGDTYEGCADLQGKVFELDQPMPPDGSHIGCRCTPVYFVEREEGGVPIDELSPEEQDAALEEEPIDMEPEMADVEA